MHIAKDKLSEIVKAWENTDSFKIYPVGSGHYNDSYEISDGKKQYILRIAPSEEIPKLFYEVDMMRCEPPVHKIVRENTTVPVPEVVHYNFKRDIIANDYLILEKLPGREGGYGLKELGKYIAQLHKIKGGGFGYIERPFPLGDKWREVFLDYAEKIFSDCLNADAITKEEYNFFLDKYDQNRRLVEQCEPSLLHLDLWYQNILTENGKISAILDFDRGMYGDIELEFAVLDTYASATPEFFDGYGNARPSDDKAKARRILYLVYELIKYAFIRLARNHNRAVARTHVEECLSLISKI